MFNAAGIRRLGPPLASLCLLVAASGCGASSLGALHSLGTGLQGLGQAALSGEVHALEARVADLEEHAAEDRELAARRIDRLERELAEARHQLQLARRAASTPAANPYEGGDGSNFLRDPAE